QHVIDQADRRPEAARPRYEAARGARPFADQLEPVVAAAADGRIYTLLINADAHRWGRYLPTDRKIELHEAAQANDEDLINLAAMMASRTGGEVVAVSADHMPGDSPVAAVLRY